MHGIWGMSYKYHERAMVTNEKNLIRLWDIAYDGYNGGKDDVFVSWTEEAGHRSWRTFKQDTANTNMPYSGKSSKYLFNNHQLCMCFTSHMQGYMDNCLIPSIFIKPNTVCM
jgi:hypothetical protein